MLVGVATLAVVIGIPTIALQLFSLGSVIVRDPDESVAMVLLRAGHTELPAHRLARLFMTTARIKGEAVIRCRSGQEVNLGYITGSLHVWRTIHARDYAPGAPAILN